MDSELKNILPLILFLISWFFYNQYRKIKNKAISSSTDDEQKEQVKAKKIDWKNFWEKFYFIASIMLLIAVLCLPLLAYGIYFGFLVNIFGKEFVWEHFAKLAVLFFPFAMFLAINIWGKVLDDFS